MLAPRRLLIGAACLALLVCWVQVTLSSAVGSEVASSRVDVHPAGALPGLEKTVEGDIDAIESDPQSLQSRVHFQKNRRRRVRPRVRQSNGEGKAWDPVAYLQQASQPMVPKNSATRKGTKYIHHHVTVVVWTGLSDKLAKYEVDMGMKPNEQLTFKRFKSKLTHEYNKQSAIRAGVANRLRKEEARHIRKMNEQLMTIKLNDQMLMRSVQNCRRKLKNDAARFRANVKRASEKINSRIKELKKAEKEEIKKVYQRIAIQATHSRTAHAHFSTQMLKHERLMPRVKAMHYLAKASIRVAVKNIRVMLRKERTEFWKALRHIRREAFVRLQQMNAVISALLRSHENMHEKLVKSKHDLKISATQQHDFRERIRADSMRIKRWIKEVRDMYMTQQSNLQMVDNQMGQLKSANKKLDASYEREKGLEESYRGMDQDLNREQASMKRNLGSLIKDFVDFTHGPHESMEMKAELESAQDALAEDDTLNGQPGAHGEGADEAMEQAEDLRADIEGQIDVAESGPGSGLEDQAGKALLEQGDEDATKADMEQASDGDGGDTESSSPPESISGDGSAMEQASEDGG